MPKAPNPTFFPYNVYVPETLLQTKLYIPPLRPNLVPRPHLIKRLNQGLQLGHILTLISAPAGFGKTTLVSEWANNLRLDGVKESQVDIRIAWLSLDEDDNDRARFLTYLITSLNQIEGMETTIGKGALGMLQSPQPPPNNSVLTSLINDIAAVPGRFVLVLDDYHLTDSSPVDDALAFLIERLPPQMHLIVSTREDPALPLARLRARGHLTELRAADLRFTSSETAEFLNQAMGLNLSTNDAAALESRTEGWIAGLHLAAISIQGHKDIKSLIESFTGSHRFVLDYLVDEVLERQTESVQNFLLQTAVLDRLTGSLCDALTGQDNGRATLEMLDHANLFVVPLDNERRWYRYHHLFADLLRQRLRQSTATSTGDKGMGVAELHGRASAWYEDKGLEIEAFHHAVAANDVERAKRLMEGDGMPLHFRGAVAPVLNWLASLPTTVLNARPSLWVTYSSVLMFVGQNDSVEQKLQAAEAALQGGEPDDKTNDFIGQIATMRAMLAIPQYQVETIFAESRRALEFLHPDNLPIRTAATWALAYAYQLQGDRSAAHQTHTEVVSIGQASGNIIFTIGSTTSLGQLQQAENQLHLAAETYRHVLQLAGDPPMPIACTAHLGLARVLYEWNDMDAAQHHGQQSIQLAQQIKSIDLPAACGVFLARLKLVQGDVAGAAAVLATADQFVQQHNFVRQMPEVAAEQVRQLLHQDNLAAAAHLAETHELPISQARVHLAQGDASVALAVLGPLRRQAEAKGWQDERLKVMVLQALAHHAYGEKEEAAQLLGDTLALAEPEGFIRTFADEGPPMAHLLYETLSRGIAPEYVGRLLAAFPAEERGQIVLPKSQISDFDLIEPLSERELEVLELIGQGLTNREIASRLYISLNTVKAHTRNIYGKLNVHSRIQAIAQSQALGLLRHRPD